MYQRAGQLVRVAALSVFVIGTSHDDVDAVVLAQRTDELRTAASPTNAVATGELLIEPPTLINQIPMV